MSLVVSDHRGNTITATDAAGHNTTYSYNQLDQPTRIVGPDGAAIEYRYGNTSWSAAPRTMAHTALIDPDLGTITYDYDDAGMLQWQQDARGNRIYVNYNPAGQPLSMNDGAPGGPVISSWTYDGGGRLDATSHANRRADGTDGGTITQAFGYTARGEIETTTWGGLPEIGSADVVMTYRDSGAVASITYLDGTPDAHTVTYGYNNVENPLTLTSGGNQIGSIGGYDRYGRVDTLTRGTGVDAVVSNYDYTNWSGRVDDVTHTGALDQFLDYQWDDNGNLIRLSENTDGVVQHQCFDYDSMDRLLEAWTHTSHCGGVSDDQGPDPYTVTYAYNPAGNITNATGTGTVEGAYSYTGSGGPHAVNSAGTNTYTYDAAGNMTQRSVDGVTQTLTYDLLNRLVELDADDPGHSDMTALYDASGNRVVRILDDETTIYLGETYELTHTPGTSGGTTTTTEATTTTQATTTTEPSTTTGPTTTTTTGSSSTTAGGGVLVAVRVSSDWNTAVFALEHNNGGTWTTVGTGTVTQGQWLTATFNAPAGTTINDLRVVNTGQNGAVFRLDWLEVDGATYQAEDPLTVADGHWDGACSQGNLEVETLHCNGWFDFSGHPIPGGGGSLIAGGYGLQGGTKTVTVRATSYYQTAHYELEADGVVVGSASVASGNGWQEASFTVDAAVTIADLRVLFDDDPNATLGVDWVSIDGVAYDADAPETLILGYRPSGSGCQPAGYHQHHNIKCAGWFDFAGHGPGGTTTTTQATTTTSQASTTTTQASTTTTEASTTTTSGPPSEAVWTHTIHHRLAGIGIGHTIDGVFHPAVTDHLGSTSATISNGVPTIERRTPFGADRGASVPLTDIGYTGQTRDPGTGLYDYNARHYDPELGRFIMADTILDGLNRYTYVHNNPLIHTDPTGHCIESFTLHDDGTYTYTAMDHPECHSGAQTGGGADGSISFDDVNRGRGPQPVRVLPSDWYEPYSITLQEFAVDTFGLVVFDHTQCTGPDASVGWCALEVASIIPISRAARLARLARHADDAATIARTAPSATHLDEAASAANGVRLNAQLAADEIAGGHAYVKHVVERGEFPGIQTRAQFADMIETVITDYSDIAHLSGGRTAYWRDGVVVIRNPSAVDGGTAFVPTDGYAYFETIN